MGGRFGLVFFFIFQNCLSFDIAMIVEFIVSIQELTKPTLDFGLWKTTFPWRVEMMNLYSCNYLHFGAPKTWYAVPPQQRQNMEDLASGKLLST